MIGPNLLAWARKIEAMPDDMRPDLLSVNQLIRAANIDLAQSILADEEERKLRAYYQTGDKLVDVDGQVWVITFIDDEEFSLELEKSKWNDDGSITISGGILGSPLSELKKYRKLAEPPSE